MNPKIMKLKEEREKNCKKISALQARNKKIEEDIITIENADILGVVREYIPYPFPAFYHPDLKRALF